MNAGQWALFGATGLTGRMVLERALAAGDKPVIVGRASPRLNELAAAHDVPARTVSLDEPDTLTAALNGCALVLNAAGPFSVTGAPLMQAAMRAGVDYLDLNGELAPLRELFNQSQQATSAGVSLVGGCGFGVAASDGPAAAVTEALGGAEWLRIAVATDSAYSSPAVTESTLGVLAGGGWEVHDRTLVRRRLARVRWHQTLLAGEKSFASAPLADLAAALHATGTERIVAGVPMPTVQAVALTASAPLLPRLLTVPPIRAVMAATGGHGGDDATRTHRSQVVVEGGRQHRRARATLNAGEGFAAAADIAVAAVHHALRQRPEPGAHTPATAFGTAFVSTVPGITVTTTAD